MLFPFQHFQSPRLTDNHQNESDKRSLLIHPCCPENVVDFYRQSRCSKVYTHILKVSDFLARTEFNKAVGPASLISSSFRGERLFRAVPTRRKIVETMVTSESRRSLDGSFPSLLSAEGIFGEASRSSVSSYLSLMCYSVM